MPPPVWSSLWFPGATFLLLATGLVFCVTRLVRGNREDTLANLPIVSAQEVVLPSPCTVVVMIEAPRTSSEFRGFQIQMLHPQTGQSHTFQYSYVMAQGAVYGLSTMQVPLGRLNAQAGIYAVRIAGLQPGMDYSNCRLILSRPYLGRMAVQIVGIVLCGIGMLGSVLWAAWSLGLLKPAQS